MKPWTLRWPDGAWLRIDLVAKRFALMRSDGATAAEADLGSVLEAEGRAAIAVELDQADPAVQEHVANHGRRGLVLMADFTAVAPGEREAAIAGARDRALHRLRRLYGHADGPSPH